MNDYDYEDLYGQPENSANADEKSETADPAFALAGMGAMVMLVSPDGKEFWVVKGSDKWKVLKSHGYRVGGVA